MKPGNAKAKEKIEAFGGEMVYNDLGHPFKGDEIIERLAGADGYIAGVDYITTDVIEKMPARREGDIELRCGHRPGGYPCLHKEGRCRDQYAGGECSCAEINHRLSR